MSDPELTNSDALESLVKQHTAPLMRTIGSLQVEIEELRQKYADATKSLAEAKSLNLVNRESRRAALNLMEDAVEARRAEQRENQERRRVEEELRLAGRRKDEFLATLAHELRNPLAPIRNSLEIIRLAGTDSGIAEQLYEMLARQVNHMVRLVDDLMEISRITRGQIDLRKEQISLATVVRSAVELSKPLVDSGRHQLAISLPAEPITLFADQTRLSQVLANLLNNAAKYTTEGGQIWLSARRDAQGVAISVRDNGLGIPTEMLPKVFELFTQVDRTLGRCQGGLGIGLTLVRSLVEAHDGTVEAHSEGVGEGSEFIVRLPLTAELGESPLTNRPKNRHLVNDRQTIMVVDDNRDAAITMQMLLRHLGAEVKMVHSGQEALDQLRAFHPSVVLLDIGMPGMDGYEVARRIRRAPELRDITLIALTGWGQDEDRSRSKQAGFDHHLVKPVELNALADLLSTISMGSGAKVT